MDTERKLIEALRKLAGWPAEVRARTWARLRGLSKREEASDGRDATA